MTSGTLIREARLRAGLSQSELALRSGRDRAQIARWEADVVQPSFETLRDLIRACGFDLELNFVPYAVDEQETTELRQSLLRTPQERLAAMLKARGRWMAGSRQERFDPIAALRALDQRRVAYVVIGGLGRVIQGSTEVTAGTDVTPSMREDNLRKLALALDDLHAHRADGEVFGLDEDLARAPVLELETDAGALKIVPEPAGTHGYDDLRRAASREPLGSGLRPSIASLGDHARMLAALGREQDAVKLRTVRRLIELERQLGLGLER